MQKTLFIFGLCIALLACSSTPKRPAWIDNVDEGVVASSGTHAMGRHAQEELAVARARERLAARLGVEVTSEMNINESVRNDRASVSSDKQTQLSVNRKQVSAKVKERWYDSTTDTIWVWVVPN